MISTKKRVIGTSESIKLITSEHIEKYLDAIVNPKNMVVTLQTPEKLKGDEKELIKKFGKMKNNSKMLRVKRVDVDQKFVRGHFLEEKMQGVFV